MQHTVMRCGTATFTKSETNVVTGYLSTAGRLFQRIKKTELDAMLRLQRQLLLQGKTASWCYSQDLYNSKVRAGEKIVKCHGIRQWV